ncbi:MAG TPA: DmsC/YnfH family molybdoenzyme membrane anchor subunit, partial [Polyangiaceae bacterium]|nr:DmsC/YnfH family molybdoenzyme membrane anchor subunit [Polyangiaceae bacterium]
MEIFSRQHDSSDTHPSEPVYRDLIPLEAPGPGEQYAFQVDLDACTGCKACVVACHVLNGLDEGESFRTVGLLHGGAPEAPVRQTVTSACHHCIEPACQSGCPTGAYEKSPLTGIVKHLDDQCFGCQYCTLMCPYDAPKYNEARGIVRKCDMCSDRLAHGEAPACVDACPTEAISIRTVPQTRTISAADAGVFLPGVASPQTTLPTTVYAGVEAMPSNLLPGDFYRSKPGAWHAPLMFMLTLTQLSVGTFVLSVLRGRAAPDFAPGAQLPTAFAAAVTLVALIASVFHLGRPALAWRAVLGIRTSWLSREALVFGLFFKMLLLCTAISAGSQIGALDAVLRALPGGARLVASSSALQLSTAILGAAGVYCSIMVYVVTRRAQWSAVLTGFKFLGTSVLLGAA